MNRKLNRGANPTVVIRTGGYTVLFLFGKDLANTNSISNSVPPLKSRQFPFSKYSFCYFTQLNSTQQPRAKTPDD